eukprot:tig00000881_g5245.t1
MARIPPLSELQLLDGSPAPAPFLDSFHKLFDDVKPAADAVASPCFAPGPFPFVPGHLGVYRGLPLAPLGPALHAPPSLRLAPLAPSALDRSAPPLGPVPPILLLPLRSLPARARPSSLRMQAAPQAAQLQPAAAVDVRVRVIGPVPICATAAGRPVSPDPAAGRLQLSLAELRVAAPSPLKRERLCDGDDADARSDSSRVSTPRANCKRARAGRDREPELERPPSPLAVAAGALPAACGAQVERPREAEAGAARGAGPVAGPDVEHGMTLERLSVLFTVSSTEAAERLAISTTRLKRIARALGVSRWPFRKIAALDRWAVVVRAVALLQRRPAPAPSPPSPRRSGPPAAPAPRPPPSPGAHAQELLGEVRAARGAVLADPNASVHAVVKRLNKALLERPAKRAGMSSIEWGRRILEQAASVAGEVGDLALQAAVQRALADTDARPDDD